MVLPCSWSATLPAWAYSATRMRVSATIPAVVGMAASSWDAACTQLSAFLFAIASQRWYRVWVCDTPEIISNTPHALTLSLGAGGDARAGAPGRAGG